MILEFPPHIVPAHGPRRKRSPELTHRCVTRYAAGMSLNEIGYLEKCSGGSVKSVLVAAGVKIRRRGVASDSFRFCSPRRRAGDQQSGAA